MDIGFTPRQITRLTGVPYSTLNLWAKNGLVRPSVSPGVGSGSERVYSFSDVVALKVAFELRKSGVTTASLKKVVQFLRENEGMEKPLAEAQLVVSGRDVLVVRNEQDLVSALARPGQSCLSFVVDLPRTIGRLIEVADAARTFAIGVVTPTTKESSDRRKQPVSSSKTQRQKRTQL